MKLTNPWVNYIDRTFSSIKSSIFDRLKVVVPELTDFNSSNLLVVIVDIFSGVSELLNYYIDITARELFLPTARKFSSVLKLANFVSYMGRGSIAAYATVLLYSQDDSGNKPLSEDLTIPHGTEFKDSDGNSWVTLTDTIFRAGFDYVSLEVRQFTLIPDLHIGDSNGSINQHFLLPSDLSDGSLVVTIDGVIWNYVNTLGFSFPTSMDYYTFLDSDSNLYLGFGDSVNGAIPSAGSQISISYWSTMGSTGNISENSITELVSILPLPTGITQFIPNNINKAYGGKDIEGIEDVRKAVPLSLRTLYRGVTRQDYLDLVTLAPGVRGAVLGFGCGYGVKVYVIPEGGGVPSASFLSDIYNFVFPKSMFTIPLSIQPSGESHVKGSVTIVGKYLMDYSRISDAVIDALIKLYDPYSISINSGVRSSDIIAAIDNVQEVDYLSLDFFYVEPYLRPSNLSLSILYDIAILPDNINPINWKIVYIASSNLFGLYRESQLLQTIQPGVSYTVNNELTVLIEDVPSGIVDGDYWTFIAYPYNKDIQLSDYSTPIIDSSDFSFDITEVYG